MSWKGWGDGAFDLPAYNARLAAGLTGHGKPAVPNQLARLAVAGTTVAGTTIVDRQPGSIKFRLSKATPANHAGGA